MQADAEKPIVEHAPVQTPVAAGPAETDIQAPTPVAAILPEPVAVMPLPAEPVDPIPMATKTAAPSGPEKKVELLSVHEDFPALDELWKSPEPAFPWADAEFPGTVAGNAAGLAGPAKTSDAQESISLSSSAAVAVAESSVAESSPAASADTKLHDEQFMEAVVERVIERMQPRMVEIFTHEILRPVVEAMVRREIEKP
jgi:hypothetical protein